MPTTRFLDLDPILSVREAIAALPADLDAKIAEYRLLLEQLVVERGIVTTLDEAKALKADVDKIIDERVAEAVRLAGAVKADADQLVAEAQKRLSSVEARDREVQAKSDAANAREQSTSLAAAALSDAQARTAADRITLDQLRSEVQARLTLVEARESAVEQGEAALRQERAAFNAKLDAMKA